MIIAKGYYSYIIICMQQNLKTTANYNMKIAGIVISELMLRGHNRFCI